MPRRFGRIVYAQRSPETKKELAEALGRIILRRRSDVSSFRSLLSSLSSLSSLENWARAHGPDSVEVRPSVKASALFIEGSAEVGLVWQLKRDMANKSFEEMADMAATLLGEPEISAELRILVDRQNNSPGTFDADFMILVGDLRLVSGLLSTLKPDSPALTGGNVRIDLDFGADSWVQDNGPFVDGRECELLGKVVRLNPLRLQCLAIWMGK